MESVTNKTTAIFEHTASSNHSLLMLNGFTAVQSHCYDNCQQGSLFIEENMLLIVIKGAFKLRFGSEEYEVKEKEMAFLKKEILVEYQTFFQTDDPSKVKYLLFSLKSDLVKEFTKLVKLTFEPSEEPKPVVITAMDSRLLNYIDSLEPFFLEPEYLIDSLIRIKLLELLFYLIGKDKDIMNQVLDLRENFRNNITTTVDENIMNSLSIDQLAVLAGRSLSSFRRDFLAIYNMPPSQWIRQKRLEKAQELLLSTTMTVTDICYTTGFESIAHFSRLFKSQVGYSPSEFRLNTCGDHQCC